VFGNMPSKTSGCQKIRGNTYVTGITILLLLLLLLCDGQVSFLKIKNA
jgi:hypothetical protein